MFSYNRNAIGLAVAYGSVTHSFGPHLSVHGTAHPMSTASVRPPLAADCLICNAVDISHPRQRGNPCAGSSVTRDPVRGVVQVQSGGVAILRRPLAGRLALFPALLSLLLSLCHRVAVSTCRRKAKYHIIVPFQVQARHLAVPHLALMLTTRTPMHVTMLHRRAFQCMHERCNDR